MDNPYYSLCRKVLDCAQVCVIISENASSSDDARWATEHLVKDLTMEAQGLLEHLREVSKRQSKEMEGS